MPRLKIMHEKPIQCPKISLCSNFFNQLGMGDYSPPPRSAWLSVFMTSDRRFLVFSLRRTNNSVRCFSLAIPP